MSKSNYAENATLDYILASTKYLSLHTGDPGETNSPTNEVTGGSYARQAITFNSASGGSKSSNSTATFTAMPAVTITYVGVYDASTSGNLLYSAALSPSRTTVAGDSVTFASGNVTATED